MRTLKFYKLFILLSTLFAVIAISACQQKSSDDEGWVYLMNGKNLDGWKVVSQNFENPSVQPEFYVEDDMIVCNTILNAGGGYLVTEKNYDDFILEVDVKIDTSLNSGIQCRGQIWDRDTVTTFYRSGRSWERKWPAGYVWSYQVEIDPSERAWSGGLYEPGNRGWIVDLENEPVKQQAFKPMDWNHLKILMEGDTIKTWVNGVPVVDITDNMSSSGFIGIQFHGASREWQKDAKSYWKNMRIKEL